MSGQDQIRVLTADVAQLRSQLQAAQAEVDQWRRAVMWRKANDWELRIWLKTGPIELGYVREGKDWLGEPAGWMAETDEGVPVSGFPDRDAACRKVCELLGLPVVLPQDATDKPKEHPAAVEVPWADKPRYPYRIAKCRKCESPIASGDDAELVAAGWERGEDTGRWYCPRCCG